MKDTHVIDHSLIENPYIRGKPQVGESLIDRFFEYISTAEDDYEFCWID
jgi:hypothetical protein